MNVTAFSLPFSDLLERVQAALPGDMPVYLVGGAVRDALMSRQTHDLDFTLPKNGIKISRRVANKLKASFFPLDTQRDTGRIITFDAHGDRHVLDFAAFRGPDLESDLRDRDFTINAMAVAMHDPGKLFDPLGGMRDLRDGLMRPCSDKAFHNDPVRILRCVRQAVDFGFQMLPETKGLARQAIPELPRVSPERMRDELFRILEGPSPTSALRILDILGALTHALPELSALKGITQPPPHSSDVWTHTLSTARLLAHILDVLGPKHDPESAANWSMGLISLRLGRYRQQLQEHLASTINPDRSLRGILLMAALYHDIGKPHTRQVESNGRVRFLAHDRSGAKIATQRATQLRLSNVEIDRLGKIIRHHMRPLLLAQTDALPTRRAIYRFFRDSGEAGVDICLLSLADSLATYGPGLPKDTWTHQLDVVRALLEAWWERNEESVSPPSLLTGRDLIQTLKMKPGPRVGQLLEAIREAQATGELGTREEAWSFARHWLQEE